METEELLNHGNRGTFVSPSPITSDTITDCDYERGVSFECGKENSTSFASWTRTVSQTPLRPPAMYSNPTLQSEQSGLSTNMTMHSVNYSTVVQQPGSVHEELISNNNIKSDDDMDGINGVNGMAALHDHVSNHRIHEELKMQHVN